MDKINNNLVSMDPEQRPANNLKKKMKNKNWGYNIEEPEVQSNNSLNKQHVQNILNHLPTSKQYKNISQLSSKYSFNIQSILGSGFASTVYLGEKIDSKQLVCIKAIDLMTLGLAPQHIAHIHKEIEHLGQFSSDYIVHLYDVYQSNTFFYLVMQLCPGGDLYRMLKMSPINLPGKFISGIIQQITRGLDQIHMKGLIHRDLKTENVLILKFPQTETERIRVKIADLGFCTTIDQIQNTKKHGNTLENVGSPIYMSPEVCQSQLYSKSSDIYALGIIWYQLYHKRAPWQATTEQQLLEKKLTIKPDNWRQDIEEDIKLTIKACISNTIQQRPSCQQIIKLLQTKI